MRAISRLRAGYQFRVRAEYKQFIRVDEYIELRAEPDLMYALQLRDEIDAAIPRTQMQIGFGAAQFGQFEPARNGDRLRRVRCQTQMPGANADAACADFCRRATDRYVDADRQAGVAVPCQLAS